MTTSKKVSVPFRGSCSEMLSTIIVDPKRHKVSVPFRGSCSEMQKVKHSLLWVRQNVSVPFRGSCSEIFQT